MSSPTPCAMVLLRNLRIYQPQRIDPRPGMSKLPNGPFVSGSTLVHTIRRLNFNPSLGFLRLLGAGTELFDQVTGDLLASGFDGYPLSIVPFRPEQSAQAWAYIGDANKMVKIGPPSTPGGMPQVQNVGIAPPLNPPVPVPGPYSFQIVDPFESLTGWTFVNGGLLIHQGPIVDEHSVGAACPDMNPVPPGFVDTLAVQPAANLAGFLQNLMVKIVDLMNGSAHYAPVTTTIAGGASDTASSVTYDSGSTGFCDIDVGAFANTYTYGQLVLISQGANSEYVAIEEYGVNAQGDTVLRVSTVYTYTAGATILQEDTVQLWGDGTSSSLIQHGMELTAGAFFFSPTVGTCTLSKNVQLNLSKTNTYGNREIQTSDVVYLAVYISDYTQIGYIAILFDVDVSINNFSVNYYRGNFGAPVANGWQIFSIAVSALSRYGSDTNRTLANVAAIQVEIQISGSVNLAVGSWWLGGPYGGTASPIGYTYFYRGRSSVTGAQSNASPGQREATFQMGTGEAINALVPSDPQIDTLDIFRQGGTLATINLLGSVPTPYGPGSYAALYDVFTDLDITAQPVLETDDFQPFPTIDVPHSGVVDVSGTTVTWVSGDQFNTRWAQGSLITINGVVYSLYQQPQSATSLQLFTSGGTQTNVPYSISGQTILGVPLPYLWGPFAQGTASYLFACGDTYQPGVLFLTNGNNPDAASDTLQIEITPPTEPLMNGIMYNGESYVWSSDRMFQLYPNFGQTLIVQNNQVLPASSTSLFVPLEIPNGKGLFGNWNLCANGTVGPKIWFRARDGIYETTGGEPKEITGGEPAGAGLSLLFPHEGMNGVPIQVGSVIVYPPDDTHPLRQKMSYAYGNVYFDYLDTQGNFRSLVYDTIKQVWSVDDYTPQVQTHYEEEGQNVNDLVVGANDGNAYQITGDTDGTGSPIPCSVNIPLLSEDVGGFQTIRMAYLGLLGASDALTLAITMDLATGSVSLTPGADYQRIFSNLPPLKGRLQQWSLSSAAPFTLMQRDGEFYVRAWGAQGPFRKINPFGTLLKALAPKIG